MERRKALAVAGTVAGTLAAAGAAMVVNFGLLGAQASEVGNLDVKGAAAMVPAPTTASTTEPAPDVTIIYQDIPVASASGGSGSSGGSAGYESSGGSAAPTPAPAPTVAAPAPAAPTPTYTDDDGGDDHGDDHSDDVEEPEEPGDDD